MALFLISYDQHRDRDYTPIWTQLQNWGAKRVLESVWFARLNATAAQVRDSLRAVSRNEDSLLVSELKADSQWATYAAQTAGTDWLRANMP